jgi:hypothetical protein
MRKLFFIVPFVLAAVQGRAADLPANPMPNIGIGAGETNSHGHLHFEGIAKDAKIVRVSTHLIVDQAAPKGLNFFAVQVNFPNQTWAHGGPQVNSGKELANWGGLVNRGGGSKDYKEVNWQEDLKLIECGVDKPNTVPFKWERGCEYVLTVERGEQLSLPAGTNAHFKVTVPARSMWKWNFTITPVGPGHDAFTSFLYDSADHLKSFYLWNEAGYGSTGQEQHTRWSLPVYRVEGSAEDKVPTGWKRF